MAYTLPIDRQVEVQVTYVDAKGNPAQISGDPQWGSSDATVLAVIGNASDPFKAMVTPVGPVGSAQVIVTAESGTLRTVITTVMDVTTAAGSAVSGTIAPTGPAVPIPGRKR